MLQSSRCRLSAGRSAPDPIQCIIKARVVAARASGSPSQQNAECSRRDLTLLGLAAAVAAPLARPDQAQAAGYAMGIGVRGQPGCGGILCGWRSVPPSLLCCSMLMQRRSASSCRALALFPHTSPATLVLTKKVQEGAQEAQDCTRRIHTAGWVRVAQRIAAIGFAAPEIIQGGGQQPSSPSPFTPHNQRNPTEASGLRIYDTEQGRGKEIKLGDTVTVSVLWRARCACSSNQMPVGQEQLAPPCTPDPPHHPATPTHRTPQVHFDCLYRGIDAVSSRYARTLGGNRTIAEPLQFVVGEFVTGSVMKEAGDSAGGLFAGSSGPKPPQAISKAVVGMKAGGRVSHDALGCGVEVGWGWGWGWALLGRFVGCCVALR